MVKKMMKSISKRVIFLLITISLSLGLSLSASAEDKAPDTATPEVAGGVIESAPAMSEGALNYIELASTVVCYREQFADPIRANQDITYYLNDIKNVTLDDYEEMRKTFGPEAGVVEALALEKALCMSRVLQHPLVEEKVAKKPKKSFSYADRLYKGQVSGQGISDGKFSARVKKDHGSFRGVIKGQKFALQMIGAREGKRMSVTSQGSKDTLVCEIALKGKKASGTCSGKLKGRYVNFRLSATDT